MHQTNDQKLSITLNGHSLEQMKSMHYLGVDVDENLTWDIYIYLIFKRRTSTETLDTSTWNRNVHDCVNVSLSRNVS